MRALGRYEIRDEIGRGTMGVVYRGYDPVIERPVALKTVLIPETLPSGRRKIFLERFLLEARIAGKLIHPNIVVTYDAARDEKTDVPFIVMELVEGEPLSRRLVGGKRIAWKDALEIAIPVGRALDYAHQSGIVHRDIKPANVLMTHGGDPKITDFGIAKLPKIDLTETGVVLGTPYFMSPEQLQGETLDGRSDLFSLGSVLYLMLVGAPPFEGADLTAVTHQVLYKHPKPPSERVPDLPPGLDEVVARALNKSPSDRFPSARSFAEDLEAVRRGETPSLGLSPGLKAQEQTAQTRACSTPGESTKKAPATRQFESLPVPPHRAFPRKRLALLMMLIGTVVYVAAVGPQRAAEQARPWVRVASWLRERVDQWREVYEETNVERERKADIRSRAGDHLDRGEELERRGQWTGAREAYDLGLDLCRGIGDGAGEAGALLARGRLETELGHWSKARADLDAAHAVYRIYDEPTGCVRALVLLGNLDRDRGMFEGAGIRYGRALSHAEALEDRLPWCEARLNVGVQDLMLGKLETARGHFDAARKAAVGRDGVAVEALVYIGAVSYATADLETASTWWEEARTACRAVDSLDCEAEIALWEGRAALDSGDYRRARAQLEPAVRHFRRQEHLPGLAAALENLLELDEKAGTPESALAEELLEVRKRLGLSEQPLPPATLEGEDLSIQRLRSLFRSVPRTAITEERLAHVVPAPAETH